MTETAKPGKTPDTYVKDNRVYHRTRRALPRTTAPKPQSEPKA